MHLVLSTHFLDTDKSWILHGVSVIKTIILKIIIIVIILNIIIIYVRIYNGLILTAKVCFKKVLVFK